MYINVNGVRLYFDVDGEGLTPDGSGMRQKPTVIMVHGGPGADHAIYKPYYSQLTDIAQVIYYDHRGNGRSDSGSEKTWNLAQWADDLKGLCDALGIERPVVIGTSFGGFVAIAYAVKYPGHAAALTLISSAARMDFQTVYDAFERLGGPDVRAIAEDYWNNPSDETRARYRERCLPLYTRDSDALPDWVSRVLWRNETALRFNGPRNEHGQMDFRSEMTRIQCPVLVMVGDEDPITPPDFSEEVVSLLPARQVTYRRFANCGHGVVADRPVEALREIRQFIIDVSG
ncbi:MAG: alpha/beta hydrolase [Pseudomonadota bacterium]